MSGSAMGGDLARQQLAELISILGELRNAGPRDQRFKQWRQITTTLLQRIWPGEPTRAEQFRRIPFSAPTAFADRHATKDYFERGCREAAAYLNGLALELGGAVTTGAPPVDRHDPVDAPAVDGPDVLDLPAASRMEPAAPPHEPASPQAPSPEPSARPVLPPPPAAWREDPPASPPLPRAPAPVDARSETLESASGPKPRLKDMLGFTEESASSPARPRAEAAAPPPRPVRFVPLSPEPLGTVGAPPARTAPPPMSDPQPPAPAEPAAAIPPPPVTSDERRHWSAAESPAASSQRPAKAASARGTELAMPATPDASGPRELLVLAGQLEALGVPARERAIVRAALVDLGRQMASPPIDWDALRQTVGFAMNHPALARRVLPLVLPYLDRAA